MYLDDANGIKFTVAAASAGDRRFSLLHVALRDESWRLHVKTSNLLDLA